jgi:outer membrane protein assembly factor BamB
VRGEPAEEWLLARGEMVSRWPIRTGVLVDRGVAYFGAGIFSHDDVFLYAVKAADGSLVWKQDNVSSLDAVRNDLSPQEYLLASDDFLVVPSGRSATRK